MDRKAEFRTGLAFAISMLAACVGSQPAEAPDVEKEPTVFPRPNIEFLYPECFRPGYSRLVGRGVEDGEFYITGAQSDSACDGWGQEPSDLSKLIIDDGRFPQCQNVKFPDRSILFEDPMTAPASWKAVQPQLRYATEFLYLNKVYGLVDRGLLPQGTKVKWAAYEYYCLPQQNGGWSRYIVQYGEGSGVGLPTGGREDGLVDIEMPPGGNLVFLERFAPRHPAGSPTKQKWLLLMAGPDQTITARNTDNSFAISWRGPVAIPIYTSPEYGDSIKFVTPERGFAEDKPLRLIPNQFID